MYRLLSACLLWIALGGERPLFGATPPSDSVVVFNELMYQPAADDTRGEWIELYNQMGVDIDLSGWRVSGGVDFTFPDGTVIGGGDFLVVAANPAEVPGSLGPFLGALSNGGERINLRNNDDRLMDTITYDDDWPWPPAADGSGATLTKISPLLPTSRVQSWRASAAVGGTPGVAESFADLPLLQISEVSAPGTDFMIELHNPGTEEISLSGWGLQSSTGASFSLPSETLASGEYRSFGGVDLGFVPGLEDRIFLTTLTGAQVIDGVRVIDRAQARRPSDSAQEPFYFPDAVTPGAANSFSFQDAIVINEIMYHARPQFPQEGTAPTFSEEVLVSFDDTWRFSQSGAFPGLTWPTPAFNDGSWPMGQGIFGVESAALPEPIRTSLTLGEVTYYFRKTFTYSGDPASDLLQLRLLIDDGAIVYLNGTEVLRDGMPEGPIDQNTLASRGVGDASTATFDLANGLVTGENTIAVEVHQVTVGSSDLVFGAELISRTIVDPGVPDTPFMESEEEWIELYNRGDAPISLAGWRLTGGIDFIFPAETVLAAGEYAVVADVASAFQQAHPDVPLLGEYQGNLNNGSDLVLLLDAMGNPADEVRYFDGGRWDGDADGHGPSLELIDPDADNSRGEVWQASDEAAKSTWQNYRYRAIADSPIGGDPTIWQEFAMGMLHGAGEILLDDVSVIQDPDGAAIERISNGSFTGSADRWRLLGNHQRSFVEDDALHLLASGATEYQGNQIETTLAGGANIVEGEEYEISFRARWLAGSSHLNTRLYFNRAAHTTELAVPTSNGTPGAPNSRLVSNAAPTFGSLRHAPLLPAARQSVAVTATVDDPDGVASAALLYRPDGGAWVRLAMTSESSGVFSATIPGQSSGTVMQFYVEATDALGATSLFPQGGPDSRALYEIDDGVSANGAVHDLRAIMLTADSDELHRPFNTLSNELQGCTVFYQGEAFYDVGIRLKGSFVGRDAERVGFNLKFHPDQLLRGVHEKLAVDRSTHGGLGIDEVLIKHIATRAGGIPGMYDDVMQFISPRSIYNRRALVRMAGFDDLYLDSQFEDGSDGTLFEYEVYRWATTTTTGDPEAPKRAGSLSFPNGFLNLPIRGYGDEKEDYRWHTLITSNRRRDNYQDVIPFLQTFALSPDELITEAPARMDVDQTLRTLAYQSLVGPDDCTFTGSVDHNFRLYARPDGKVIYLPWDWDSAFRRSTNAPLVGGGNLARLVNQPANLRRYHGHLRDIIEKAFNVTYMSAWASHYGSLGGQNFTNRLNYIQARANSVLAQLPAEIPFRITSNGGNDFTVFTSNATLSGRGWFDVAEIRLTPDGAPIPVEWTTTDQWRITIPLSSGVNALTVLAYDRDGQQVGSDSVTITNISSREAASAENFIISELMYHPQDGGMEFVEFLNIGDGTIDLTGVRFGDGIEFAFAEGVTLGAGERLVVEAADFLNETKLNNGGERVVLLAGDGSVIMEFTYSNLAPWPSVADGAGPSLVLINPESRPDATSPMNWRRSVAPGGNPGTDDSLPFTGTVGADANGNGVEDLLEYALGEEVPRVSITRIGEGATISYRRRIAADDVRFAIEWSNDLNLWEVLAEAGEQVQSSPAASSELVFTTVPSVPFEGSEKVFARIVVTLREP